MILSENLMTTKRDSNLSPDDGQSVDGRVGRSQVRDLTRPTAETARWILAPGKYPAFRAPKPTRWLSVDVLSQSCHHLSNQQINYFPGSTRIIPSSDHCEKVFKTLLTQKYSDELSIVDYASRHQQASP